nr:immunoglobulin heavy chain junction region [Macaca mulatta]MOX06865.1 immunoglobulin heavy chain junction region [Macaca mulatta]
CARGGYCNSINCYVREYFEFW